LNRDPARWLCWAILRNMQFAYSPKVQQLRERVDSFMQQHVYPNEQRFYREIEENTQRGALGYGIYSFPSLRTALG